MDRDDAQEADDAFNAAMDASIAEEREHGQEYRELKLAEWGEAVVVTLAPLPPGCLKHCPECGSRMLASLDGERVFCSNYGGCEYAPG